MLVANPVTDPVLRRTIHSIVERQTRHLPADEQREVRKDLVQELRLQVLELAHSFRGDNGATFATFVYRALALHAYHVLKSYERPVHAGKNNQERWRMQRAGTGTVSARMQRAGAHTAWGEDNRGELIDRAQAETPGADELADEASVGTHLRALAKQVARKNHEAVEAIVLREETIESVAARTGRPMGELRRAVRRYHARVAEDRKLREYATGR